MGVCVCMKCNKCYNLETIRCPEACSTRTSARVWIHFVISWRDRNVRQANFNFLLLSRRTVQFHHFRQVAHSKFLEIGLLDSWMMVSWKFRPHRYHLRWRRSVEGTEAFHLPPPERLWFRPRCPGGHDARRDRWADGRHRPTGPFASARNCRHQDHLQRVRHQHPSGYGGRQEIPTRRCKVPQTAGHHRRNLPCGTVGARDHRSARLPAARLSLPQRLFGQTGGSGRQHDPIRWGKFNWIQSHFHRWEETGNPKRSNWPLLGIRVQVQHEICIWCDMAWPAVLMRSTACIGVGGKSSGFISYPFVHTWMNESLSAPIKVRGMAVWNWNSRSRFGSTTPSA